MRKYKCDCCGDVFSDPELIGEATGVYAPDGVGEIQMVASCPHCGSTEIRSVYVCRLCDAEEVDDHMDFCDECLEELEKKILKFAKWYGTDRETIMDAVYEVAMRN